MSRRGYAASIGQCPRRSTRSAELRRRAGGRRCEQHDRLRSGGGETWRQADPCRGGVTQLRSDNARGDQPDRQSSDAVLVVGDVNSPIACGLVAVKLGVKLIHVEAGLRSFDRTMPEEINQIGRAPTPCWWSAM